MSRQRAWPFEEAWQRVMWAAEYGEAPWWAQQVVRLDAVRMKLWVRFVHRFGTRQECGCTTLVGRRQFICQEHIREMLNLPSKDNLTKPGDA